MAGTNIINVSAAQVSIKWRAPYVSSALNQKASAAARGIVRGFMLAPNPDPALPDSVVVAPDPTTGDSVCQGIGRVGSGNSEYTLTWRAQAGLAFSAAAFPAGEISYVAFLPGYQQMNETTPEIRRYSSYEYEQGLLDADGAILLGAVRPAATITVNDIYFAGMTEAGDVDPGGVSVGGFPFWRQMAQHWGASGQASLGQETIVYNSTYSNYDQANQAINMVTAGFSSTSGSVTFQGGPAPSGTGYLRVDYTATPSSSGMLTLNTGSWDLPFETDGSASPALNYQRVRLEVVYRTTGFPAGTDLENGGQASGDLNGYCPWLIMSGPGQSFDEGDYIQPNNGGVGGSPTIGRDAAPFRTTDGAWHIYVQEYLITPDVNPAREYCAGRFALYMLPYENGNAMTGTIDIDRVTVTTLQEPSDVVELGNLPPGQTLSTPATENPYIPRSGNTQGVTTSGLAIKSPLGGQMTEIPSLTSTGQMPNGRQGGGRLVAWPLAINGPFTRPAGAGWIPARGAVLPTFTFGMPQIDFFIYGANDPVFPPNTAGDNQSRLQPLTNVKIATSAEEELFDQVGLTVEGHGFVKAELGGNVEVGVDASDNPGLNPVNGLLMDSGCTLKTSYIEGNNPAFGDAALTEFVYTGDGTLPGPTPTDPTRGTKVLVYPKDEGPAGALVYSADYPFADQSAVSSLVLQTGLNSSYHNDWGPTLTQAASSPAGGFSGQVRCRVVDSTEAVGVAARNTCAAFGTIVCGGILPPSSAFNNTIPPTFDSSFAAAFKVTGSDGWNFQSAFLVDKSGVDDYGVLNVRTWIPTNALEDGAIERAVIDFKQIYDFGAGTGDAETSGWYTDYSGSGQTAGEVMSGTGGGGGGADWVKSGPDRWCIYPYSEDVGGTNYLSFQVMGQSIYEPSTTTVNAAGSGYGMFKGPLTPGFTVGPDTFYEPAYFTFTIHNLGFVLL